MQRFRLGAAAVSMLVLTGCVPMNVSSYKERDVDFARFQTYNWAPAAEFSTGDPRLDNNPFFHEYFRDAVEARMRALGLRRASGDDPDLLIRYHATVSQSFSVAAPDEECRGGRDCEPRVVDYETGTLSLDVVDSATNRTVWRGWSRQSVDGLIDSQEWMEQYISKSVEKMMKGFGAARATNQTDE
jgi:hypothetical protein